MQRYVDPTLKETLYTDRLACGLGVAVLVKPGFRTTTAHISTNYGSVDSRFVDPATGNEVQVPDGIAHFLEHKLFEEEWGNVSDKFSELGADSNAYTTYTHTNYYFETTEHFEPAVELLLDFVQAPHFTDEGVDKEQGIIEQEIRMYLDDPGWRSQMTMMEALYRDHPVRIDIAGTVESIRQITKETLYLCHSTFYHPSNMVLFVAGDVDPEKVRAMAEASFGRRAYKPQAEIARLLPEEPAEVAERRMTERLVVSQPTFRLAFKDTPVGRGGRPLLERDLLTTVVLEAIAGRGSTLYNRLYEEGLIDQRFGYEHTAEETYGHTYFVAPTRDAAKLERRLLEEIARVRSEGIPSDDFERARKKAIGRLISAMNHLDTVAYLFLDGHFKGISIFDILPTLQSLTPEQANERLRTHFDPGQAVVTVIEPS